MKFTCNSTGPSTLYWSSSELIEGEGSELGGSQLEFHLSDENGTILRSKNALATAILIFIDNTTSRFISELTVKIPNSVTQFTVTCDGQSVTYTRSGKYQMTLIFQFQAN